MLLFYNNVAINVTITGTNSKSRYRCYDNSKFTLYFCRLGLVIQAFAMTSLFRHVQKNKIV
uniref:Photosystem I subunit VIII n=1 Tax=Cecarria obtusifolia TaxID=364664 RepID=A0A8K1HLC6_9MAGN|nr:photosystem I subunit VIII [Cecarria obtusifolia]UBN07816.1 photosystem I subunit VIII [Cecarria obtusifolia]